jgi:hypothetical protein
MFGNIVTVTLLPSEYVLVATYSTLIWMVFFTGWYVTVQCLLYTEEEENIYVCSSRLGLIKMDHRHSGNGVHGLVTLLPTSSGLPAPCEC